MKSSKKIIPLSCIGLIIALTLISSSLYFLENSRQDVLANYLKGESTGNDIQFNIHSDFTTDVSSGINIIHSTFLTATSQFNFNYINTSAIRITYGLGNFKTNGSLFVPGYYSASNFLPLTVYQMTPDILSELKQIHMDIYGNDSITLPQQATNESDTLQSYFLFNAINWNVQAPISNLSTGQFKFYTNYISRYNYLESFNLSVVGSESLQSYYFSSSQNQNILTSRSQTNYPLIYSLSLSTNTPSVMAFVANITQFANQVNTRIENQKSIPDILLQPNRPYIDNQSVWNVYTVNLELDYSSLNILNINSFLNSQDFFSGSIIGILGTQGFQTSPPIYLVNGLLVQVYNQIQSLTSEIIFIDLPSLIIALLLAHYVFSLIYKNVIRNIGIYKTRGTPGKAIILFQVTDLFFILILSILTAFLFGIPLSVFSLKSDYLLSFNNPLPSSYYFNFETVAITLVYSAIILEIIINTNRIRKLSKISLSEVDNPVERGDSFWSSNFLEILLIVYGIGTYLFYDFIISNASLYKSFLPVLPIFDILMIPSPFAFTIGCILLLSRIVPRIISGTVTFLWIHTNNLTALSFKNIIRYKNNAIRAILITATIIAFLTFFYAQPYSMLENYHQTIYYQSGADGVAVFNSNQVDPQTLKILSTNYSAEIESICPYVLLGGSTQGSGPSQQFNLLLVNTSTYVKTAYLDYDLGLQQNSVPEAFSKLNISQSSSFSYKTPISILMDQNSLNQLHGSIGSYITITGGYLKILFRPAILLYQNFSIVDSFSNWPFFIPHVEQLYGTSINAIGDINYFLKDLQGSTYQTMFNSVEAGIFIKFKDISSSQLSKAISQIEGSLPITFTNVAKLQYESNMQNFAFFAIGEVNINVLISLAIIIIVIIFFIQLQMIERKREIYTERAMGMKLSQFLYMFYIENIFIIALSIVIGTLGGLFLIQAISILASNSSLEYLYAIVFVPLNTLILTDGIILLLSFFISLIPTIIILKQDISEAFTGDV